MPSHPLNFWLTFVFTFILCLFIRNDSGIVTHYYNNKWSLIKSKYPQLKHQLIFLFLLKKKPSKIFANGRISLWDIHFISFLQ
jgi:uncharacterized membrane protein